MNGKLLLYLDKPRRSVMAVSDYCLRHCATFQSTMVWGQNLRVCDILQDRKGVHLIISRPDSTRVFSGSFDNGTEDNSFSTLQRTFAGTAVPLEVFKTTASIESVDPTTVCEDLQSSNPGA